MILILIKSDLILNEQKNVVGLVLENSI
jgi:hypothetical protein